MKKFHHVEYSILPIYFIGLAEELRKENLPFPIGKLDIFGLSQRKTYTVFPIDTKPFSFIFAINLEVYEKIKELKIDIYDEIGNELGSFNFQLKKSDKTEVDSTSRESITFFPASSKWSIITGEIDIFISKPGTFFLKTDLDSEKLTIGDFSLFYQKASPLSIETIRAIESDPNSSKAVKFEIFCKNCSGRIKMYTALKRSPKIEASGFIWNEDLPNSFHCDCGRTEVDLIYVKESLHSLLGKDIKLFEGITHSRRYLHEEVLKKVKEFKELIGKKKDEKSVQEFLEKKPILFAKFHAKKIFVKPKILGKFIADFAVLDSSNQLLLIEIERPSLHLFKNDGHRTADLMHAYEQIKDWLNEYNRNFHAFLEGLNLGQDEVGAVKGVVIAGISEKENPKHLRRHLSSPPYPDIDFLTFDDLHKSLSQISRELF